MEIYIYKNYYNYNVDDIQVLYKLFKIYDWNKDYEYKFYKIFDKNIITYIKSWYYCDCIQRFGESDRDCNCYLSYGLINVKIKSYYIDMAKTIDNRIYVRINNFDYILPDQDNIITEKNKYFILSKLK